MICSSLQIKTITNNLVLATLHNLTVFDRLLQSNHYHSTPLLCTTFCAQNFLHTVQFKEYMYVIDFCVTRFWLVPE
jgi:hypothetical protein